jgi:uncharacterized protein (TIGR02246 family)
MSASLHMLQRHVETVDRAVDEAAAIRQVVARTRQAWEHGDGEAYAACFSEDCDYTTFSGLHLHGRRQNADLHGALLRGPLKGTTIAPEIEGVDFIAGDVALVRTVSHGRAEGRQSYVLVKRGDEWLIRSFQNTRVQPFANWITRWFQGIAA